MKKLLRILRDYKKESILAPLFKMLEASFDQVSFTYYNAAKAMSFVQQNKTSY